MSYPILIVDHDRRRLEHVRHLIEGEGADAVTASDAREALRLFTLRAPILTLLHLDPPAGLDLALCGEMKSVGLAPLRPVVVVAARAARSAAFDAGCDAFLDCQSGDQPIQQAVRRSLAPQKQPRQQGPIVVSM
jgi:CheY-like chemotaxis protein